MTARFFLSRKCIIQLWVDCVDEFGFPLYNNNKLPFRVSKAKNKLCSFHLPSTWNLVCVTWKNTKEASLVIRCSHVTSFFSSKKIHAINILTIILINENAKADKLYLTQKFWIVRQHFGMVLSSFFLMPTANCYDDLIKLLITSRQVGFTKDTMKTSRTAVTNNNFVYFMIENW